MKKLAIILLVVLVVVLSINTLLDSPKAKEQTLGEVVANLKSIMSKFEVEDIDTLNSKITPEELTDCAKLVTQYEALLKVSKEAGKIISGR